PAPFPYTTLFRSGLIPLAMLLERAAEQLADFGVFRALREILERLQRLRHTVLARSVLGIVEEPAACVCQETLGRAELAELAQQVEVFGRVAQRLVAERDGVVGEARVGVAICGLRVVANGVVRLADASVE